MRAPPNKPTKLTVAFVARSLAAPAQFDALDAWRQGVLFKLRSDVAGSDFSPDGERILAAVPAGPPQALSITVELNWLAAIEH